MTYWYHDPQRADALAAQYVLGTLKGRARRRFEVLVRAHPTLRARVQYWELALNQLAAGVPPVSPQPALWTQLHTRLFTEPPAPSLRWFERLNVWRLTAAINGVIAAALVAFVLLTPFYESPGYFVMIVDRESNQPAWVASASADMERFYVKNVQAPILPTTKPMRCLLWLQPEGSQHLYALGALPDKGGQMVLTVDKPMRTKMPGQLWVSVEEMSDEMPTAPSGPVAYKGQWLPMKNHTRS